MVANVVTWRKVVATTSCDCCHRESQTQGFHAGPFESEIHIFCEIFLIIKTCGDQV